MHKTDSEKNKEKSILFPIIDKMFQCIVNNKRIIIALVIALVLLSFFVSSFFSRNKNEIDLINFSDSKDSLSSHIQPY